MKRILKLITSVLLISIFLMGCSSANKTTIDSSKELVFGTTLKTNSLDPHKDYAGWFTVRYGVGETLFKLNESLEEETLLAKGYNMIDINTWEIFIKDNIRFQNGEVLDSNKVKLSLERTLSENSRAKKALKIDTIESKENSIIIRTKDPNPTLIKDLCDPFATIIDVENTEDFNNNPIGTGPFKVEKFNYDKSSYFIKNEDYWQGKVSLERLKIIPIEDADTLSMALQSGEIDAAQGIPYSMIQFFERDDSYKISTVDTSRVILMYYNFNNNLLKDKNLRKAINMLIDKESYTNNLLKGSASTTLGAFLDVTDFGSSKLNGDVFNKEEGYRLLEESGYKDTDGDGYLDKDGQKLTFKILTYSSRTELPILAQAIQASLKEAKIDVTIEVVENIMDRIALGDFDLALYSNVTSSTGDPLAYLSYAMKTDGASNYGNYSNPTIDDLINKLELEFNEKSRDELAIEIQNLALEDSAYNFLAHLKMSFVMKSNVSNLEVHPTDYYQFTKDTTIE